MAGEIRIFQMRPKKGQGMTGGLWEWCRGAVVGCCPDGMQGATPGRVGENADPTQSGAFTHWERGLF